jgi:Flp pilus assembly protein CpaB
VAAAGLGTWWASAGADRDTSSAYVIAAHDLAPGQRIEVDDLRLVPMALSPSVAAGAFTDQPTVVGHVALGPIGAGELVQSHALAPSTGTRSGREISFAVETPWAVDGALRPGDRIDVFATSAAGDEGRTDEVLRGVVVRHLSSTGGGLGEPTGLTITVAVQDGADLGDAVSALRAAELTVVRSTGVTAVESSAQEAPSTPDRGDPLPRSTTSTTSTPRSPGQPRSVTTTTARTGAGS